MSDNLIVHFCNVRELSKGNYGYGLPSSIKLVTKTNNAVRTVRSSGERCVLTVPRASTSLQCRSSATRCTR